MRNFINILSESIESPNKIAIVTRDLLVKEKGRSPREINAGECFDFADALEAEHPDMFEAMEMANLFNHDFDAGECSDDATGFDLTMAKRVFPHIAPPTGFTWEEAFERVPTGSHVWSLCHVDGKSRDIECVEGVDNPFDLPWFKREFAS